MTSMTTKKNKADLAQKEKLTRNEKLTLIIASIALIGSLCQLFLSSQLFIDWFVKPDIYASAKSYYVDKGDVISTFEIKNKGNKTAEDVIISLSVFKNDFFTIYPISILDTSERKNGEPLKDLIIKTSRFVPNDFIFIQVTTDTSTFFNAQRQLINQNIRPSAFIIPNLNFVKYRDGMVSIDRYVQQ
jgi:hypothetical protein